MLIFETQNCWILTLKRNIHANTNHTFICRTIYVCHLGSLTNWTFRGAGCGLRRPQVIFPRPAKRRNDCNNRVIFVWNHEFLCLFFWTNITFFGEKLIVLSLGRAKLSLVVNLAVRAIDLFGVTLTYFLVIVGHSGQWLIWTSSTWKVKQNTLGKMSYQSVPTKRSFLARHHRKKLLNLYKHILITTCLPP